VEEERSAAESVHVLSAAASVGNNNGGWPWPVAPRRLPTRAAPPSRAAATHCSAWPVSGLYTAHTAHTAHPHHKETPKSTSFMVNLHGNPQWRFSLPFCASDMRRYPKKACGWTNNDRTRTPPFRFCFCFGPSRLWEVQKYCCNVRAMFSAAMRHWPNVSMVRGEPTKVT
jgi:hypothetical protein